MKTITLNLEEGVTITLDAAYIEEVEVLNKEEYEYNIHTTENMSKREFRRLAVISNTKVTIAHNPEADK